MKKFIRVISLIMTVLMIVSSMPLITSSAQTGLVPITPLPPLYSVPTISSGAKPQFAIANKSKGIYIECATIAYTDKYEVYRKTEGTSTFKLIKTVYGEIAPAFTDTNVVSGTKYTYKIVGYLDSYKQSSKELSLTWLAVPVLVNKTNKKGVSFKWNAVKGAERYEVYRAIVNKSSYTLVQNSKKTSYTEWYNGGKFKYVVRAVKGNFAGARSKELKITYYAKPIISASISEDYESVEVAWGSIDNVKGYKIYRSTKKNKKGTMIKKLTVQKCKDLINKKLSDNKNGVYVYEYPDKNVKHGKKYFYTVEAYAGSNKSVSKKSKVKYYEALYFVEKGSVSTAFAEEYNEIKEEAEHYGITYTFKSSDKSIFTLDENYNIIGVSEGKANIICIAEYNGEKSKLKLPVKVTPAEIVDTNPEPDTDTPVDTNPETETDSTVDEETVI